MNATWIWSGENRISEFAFDFTPTKRIRRVDINVSAETHYRLRINGRFAGTGPAPVGGDWLPLDKPPYYFYDTVTWQPEAGETTIAIRALVIPNRQFGFDVGFGRPGFFLRATVEYADGTREAFGTSQAWRARIATEYAGPRDFDSRRLNDATSDWRAAEKIEDVWHAEPSNLPMRDEYDVFPANPEAIEIPPGETREVVLDFDRIRCAYPCARTSGPARISLFAFEREAGAAPTESVAFGGAGEYRSLIMTSVGAMKLVAESLSDKPLRVTGWIVATEFPVREIVRPEIADASLAEVFEVCVATLRICRQHMHFDSPKHLEPLACTGDYYIESLLAERVFRDMRLAEADVRRTGRWLAAADGRLFHTTYSLIWVLMLDDVSRATGDDRILRDCEHALAILLARFKSYIGGTGIVETPPDYMFVDWAFVDGHSMHHPPKCLGQTVLNGFYCLALGAAADIYRRLGDPQRADELLRLRADVIANLNALLYDPDKRLYHDGHSTSDPTTDWKWHPANPEGKSYATPYANTMAVLAGAPADASVARRIMRWVVEEQLDIVQPYFMHFVFEALKETGLYDEFAPGLLRRWIPLVEDFDKGLREGFYEPPGYGFDYSHAWGATAAIQLFDRATFLKQPQPWHGFERIAFEVMGKKAWVAFPRQPLEGRPWVWCMEFPEAFDTRTGAVPLCEAGFAYAHVAVGNTYGYDGAQAVFDAFHAEMVSRGFARKAALIAISRGGLYAYRFAARRPECVACIYGDAPVCDFRSWPGGFGTGRGSAADWEALKRLHGFANDEEARQSGRQPFDALAPLAEAGIPLLHVVGDADDVVPVAENTAVLAERYRALGGAIEVFHKVPDASIAVESEIRDVGDDRVFRAAPARCGHHPHGLADTSIAVDFIVRGIGR